MKFLLIFGLVLIVFWFLRNLSRGLGSARAPERRPERMVQCARCGVHLPESESLRDGEVHYCCAEHRADRHAE